MADRRNVVDDQGTFANPAKKRKRSESDTDTESDPEELAVDDEMTLFQAIFQDRLDLVQSLLEDTTGGADVNEVVEMSEDAATPLFVALMFQRFNIIPLLLKYGADANHEAEDGHTPLFPAIGYGCRETVRTLLEHGADANHETKSGWTPLYVALDQEKWEIVQMLLEHGADANGPLADEEDPTPLIYSIHYGPFEVVQSMLEHGADPKQTCFPHSLPPLLFALFLERFDVAKVLIEHGADVHQGSLRQQISMLTIIARHGNSKGVETLLEAGADPNPARDPDMLPLVAAIGGGHLGVTQLLLKYKADVEPAFDYFADRSGDASFVKWIRQDPQRTFLSLRTLAQETNEEATKVRINFNLAVTLLWAHYHGDLDHDGGPSLLQETAKGLSDDEFKMRYRWMIYATASLIHRDHDILQQLLRVYSADVAVEKCPFTENTPLETALDVFSDSNSRDDDYDDEYTLIGLEMIMKWGPRALRLRDAICGGRRPVEVAIKRGLPMKTIEKMVLLWPASVQIRDPVTGLYVFMMVAARPRSYSASDVYCVSRGVLPDMIATLVKDNRTV